VANCFVDAVNLLTGHDILNKMRLGMGAQLF